MRRRRKVMGTLQAPQQPPLPSPPRYQQLIMAATPLPPAAALLNATHMASVDDDSSNQPFHWHYGDLDDKNNQVNGRSLLLVIVIFSILLFLALLCLYARWVCRYRRIVVTVSSGSSAHAFSGGGGTRQTGLDRETIDGIPVKLHVSGGGEEAQCSICLSGLLDGEKVKVLPGCFHGFHPECVDEWLRAQPTCPLCRASLGPSPSEPLEAVV